MAGAMAPATDVLGAARPAGSAIDIGAYELGGVAQPGTGGASGGGAGGATGAGGGTGTGGTPGAGTGGHAGNVDAGSNDAVPTAGAASGGCGCRTAGAGGSFFASILTALAVATCARRRRRSTGR
jgi:hypothetical protein